MEINIDYRNPCNMNIPQECPACHEELSWKGVHLICTNTNCAGRNYSDIHSWIVNLANIPDLGGSLIHKVITGLNICSINDLYKPQNLDLLYQVDGIGSAKIELVKKMFFELTMVPKHISQYLLAMNIEGLGWKSVQKIIYETNFNNEIQEDFFSSTFETNLMELKGVNYNTKVEILRNWGRIVDLLQDKLVNYNNIIKIPEDTDSGKIKLCITGRLTGLTKSNFYKVYSSKVVESEVEDCDYLLCNEDKNSIKTRKAKDLGKPILNEEDFLKLIVG